MNNRGLSLSDLIFIGAAVIYASSNPNIFVDIDKNSTSKFSEQVKQDQAIKRSRELMSKVLNLYK